MRRDRRISPWREPSTPAAFPRHIAIIMDGNGRWAQQRSLPRVAGHKEGVPAVRTTVFTAEFARLVRDKGRALKWIQFTTVGVEIG